MSKKEANNIKAFEDLVKVASYGGPSPIDVDDIFSLAPIAPISGQWYFGAQCPDCRNISPAFRDESAGHLSAYFEECVRMRLHLRCVLCQCHIQIQARNLQSIRWP